MSTWIIAACQTCGRTQFRSSVDTMYFYSSLSTNIVKELILKHEKLIISSIFPSMIRIFDVDLWLKFKFSLVILQHMKIVSFSSSWLNGESESERDAVYTVIVLIPSLFLFCFLQKKCSISELAKNGYHVAMVLGPHQMRIFKIEWVSGNKDTEMMCPKMLISKRQYSDCAIYCAIVNYCFGNHHCLVIISPSFLHEIFKKSEKNFSF